MGFTHLARLVTTVALTGGLIAAAAPADAAPADGVSAGPNFYVDCSAPAGGDGSMDHPWSSVAAVNSHGPFAAGNQILLKRGTTCTGRLAPSGSGTAAGAIVLGAYGSGALPTVNGGGTPNGTGTVQLVNQPYWTVQDLHLTNRGTSGTATTYRSAVMIRNVKGGRIAGITVQGLRIDKVVSKLGGWEPRSYGGISVLTSGKAGDGFDGVRIRNNTITGVGRTGIMSANGEEPKGHDRDLRISGNVIRSVQGDSIVALGVVGARIDHNLSANGARAGRCAACGALGARTAHAAIWPIRSSNVIIEYNEAYGENAAGGDGEAFDIDRSAKNVVLQYNYAHDNAGGAVLLCGSIDAVVRFNIFQNNQRSAIAFIGKFPAKNTSIYNNTIYASKKTAAGNVRTFDGLHGSGVRFFNNVVYNDGQAGWTFPTRVTARANTFVGRIGHDEPSGPGTTHVDPRLKRPGTGGTGFANLSGYKPKAGVHRPAGVAIPSSVTRDFFGKKINPKKPPRGAAG